MTTIYHAFFLFLAVMFALAAMIEIASPHHKWWISGTMAFTSILCIGTLAMAVAVQ